MIKNCLFCALFLIFGSSAHADSKPQFPEKGNAKAPITIVTFSDFQCPYCATASDTMNTLLKSYGDQLRLVYRNMPLPSHPDAMSAAESSVCGYQQNKFWEIHDLLLNSQGNLNETTYLDFANRLGLNIAEFKDCLKLQSTKATVVTDLADAEILAIRATPSFVISSGTRTVKVTGALPIEEFKKTIDDLLKNP